MGMSITLAFYIWLLSAQNHVEMNDAEKIGDVGKFVLLKDKNVK